MSFDDVKVQFGQERRVHTIQIRKVVGRYIAHGLGPKNSIIFREEASQIVCGNGTITEIKGIKEQINVTSAAAGGLLDIQKEAVAQTGVTILRITPASGPIQKLR